MHEKGSQIFLPTGFLSAGFSSCLKTLYLSPISVSEKTGAVLYEKADH